MRAHALLFTTVALLAALAGGVTSARAKPLPVPFQSEYLAENWGLEEGFPENSCSGIVRAPDGSMWMGTFRGLVRFNGQKFTPWAPAAMPALKSTSIVNMYRDRRGRIWISTAEGLVLHDHGTWRQWQENDGWGNRADFVRSYAEHRDGTLVLTRFGGRVMQFEENGTWREIPPPPGSGGTICAFDEQGGLVAVRTGYVGWWHEGAWREIAGVDGSAKDALGAGQTRDGRALVVGRQEVLHVSAGRVVARVALSEPVQHFWQLAEDEAGAWWLASLASGVYRIQPDGTVKHLLKADGLVHSGGTRVVYHDDERIVWIGSGVGGVSRLRPRRFRHLGESEGMGDRVILTLAPLPDGRVLLTSYGSDGLAYFDGEKKVERFAAGKLGTAPVRSVVRRRDGSVWLGTFGSGLLRLDGPEITPVRSEIFGPREPISTLFEDSRDRLWVGSDNQAAVLENNEFRRVGPLGIAERTSATLFAERPNGTIVLARHNEVFEFGPSGLNPAPILRLGGDERIATVLVDREDRLWIGTARHGLVVVHGTEQHRLTTEQGLPGDAISSLVQDDRGLLWFGSNRQIVRAAVGELWHAARTPGTLPTIRSFDQGDGLRDLDFPTSTQPSVAKDTRGRLWFALIRGAARVDPAELHFKDRIPPVVVESLSYVPDGASRPVELTADQSPVLALPAGSRLIRISYAAMDFISPAKQRFRVRLAEEGTQWQDMRDETTATFLQLPPGRHTLQVQAASGDGSWHHAGGMLVFTIAPFYWQTMWFRVLAALGGAALVGGCVWLLAQNRTRHERERHERENHLREAQIRLALVLENTSDFVQFADADGRVLYVNRAGRALVGLKPDDDLRAKRTSDFLVLAASGSYTQRALASALRDGVWSGESALVHRDGRAIPVSLVLLAHRAPDGQLDFTSVIARDISTAKRDLLVQEALRQLAMKLSAALETPDLGRAVAETCRELFAPDAFFFVPLDARGSVDFGAYVEDTSPGESSPKPVPAKMRSLSAALNPVIAGEPLLINRDGSPDDPTFNLLEAGGFRTRRSASLAFAPVRWENKTIAVISVQSYRTQRFGPPDIQLLQTLAAHCAGAIARLKAEATLRENEERLRLAMQSARMGSWEIAVTSRRLHASPEAEAVYGCPPGELSGPVENLGRHAPTEEAAELLRLLTALLAGRTTSLDFSHRLLLADGTERWVEVKGRLLHPPGSPDQVRVIGATADITERRLAEIQRGRLEQQLLQAQKLESIGTLAGGIAHDFNNILTAILGNTELARMDLPPGDPLHEPLEEIRRSSHRARDLVRRILAFSRPHESRQRIFAALPLVEEVVKLLRATIPATVEITVTAAPSLPCIEADSSEIHQVLLNLGTNAWQALAPRAGHVTFTLDTFTLTPTAPPPHPNLTAGDYVRIAVADNGPGISSAVLPRIFDPFFTTKGPGEGTGLGLSVAHGIMSSVRGAITVASTVGQGTVFTLYFPASAGEPTSLTERPAPAPVAKLGRGQNILCVDDEKTIVVLMDRLLTGAGFTVTGCVQPHEALARFRAEPGAFALVVTDLAMPQMSGIDLTRELRRLRPDLPVILTSGYLRPADTEAAAAVGIREIIQKPQSLDQIVPTIVRLLAEPTDTPPQN
jgi:PAS domain S-box-containing protein